MFSKMKNTWERVIKRGKDLGKISCGADESYRHWLKVRVQIVKVPFCNLILVIEGMFVQASIDMREVKELKEALAKFEEEMNMLKLELMESCQMCKVMQDGEHSKEAVFKGSKWKGKD